MLGSDRKRYMIIYTKKIHQEVKERVLLCYEYFK